MVNYDDSCINDTSYAQQHNNILKMRYTEENENDNNYNEYRLSPPFPFRYETSSSIMSDCSYSLNHADVTECNDTGNNNMTIVNADENDYDDVQDDNPRKKLLKQMFCLPLH
ncbi:hypothetical protein PV327_008872 [Microctonus hyperodae]|uniref:Uncharacterized protein n=1 Tax=Microctonus hyperodae TaxID=165561 RepID=A0AA39KVG4_MICHY|nr:hypothetical protein PV327_008872 [Microctonus hyperodae]